MCFSSCDLSDRSGDPPLERTGLTTGEITISHSGITSGHSGITSEDLRLTNLQSRMTISQSGMTSEQVEVADPHV